MKNPRQYFRQVSWLTVFICLPWAVAEGQEPYLLATVKAPLEATNLHPDITHINMTIRFFADGGAATDYHQFLDEDGHGCETVECLDYILAEGTASVGVRPQDNGTINEVVEIPVMLEGQNEFGANITWEELDLDGYNGGSYILHVWANGGNAFKEDGSSADPAFNLVSANFYASAMKYAKRGDVDDLLTEQFVDEE